MPIDAYFTVPISASHRRFLRFRWRGVNYEFACLPASFASASFFFGLIIDSLSMSFALPEGKLDKTRTLCQGALAAGRVRLRDLASIMGMFSWSIPAIHFA